MKNITLRKQKFRLKKVHLYFEKKKKTRALNWIR